MSCVLDMFSNKNENFWCSRSWKYECPELALRVVVAVSFNSGSKNIKSLNIKILQVEEEVWVGLYDLIFSKHIRTYSSKWVLPSCLQ